MRASFRGTFHLYDNGVNQDLTSQKWTNALPAVLIQRSTRERAAPVAKLMSLLLSEANLFDFLCDHVDSEKESIHRRTLPNLDVLRGACTRVTHP